MEFCDPFYADAVIGAMAHSRGEILITEACKAEVGSKEVLTTKGLSTTHDKSANMLLSPNDKRTPNSHQAAAMELKK